MCVAAGKGVQPRGLRSSDRLLAPDHYKLLGTETSGVVFRHTGPGDSRVVGHRHLADAVEERVYLPDYGPENPATRQLLSEPGVVIETVSRFAIAIEEIDNPGLLTLELVVRTGVEPVHLRTRVRRREVQ